MEGSHRTVDQAGTKTSDSSPASALPPSGLQDSHIYAQTKQHSIQLSSTTRLTLHASIALNVLLISYILALLPPSHVPFNFQPRSIERWSEDMSDSSHCNSSGKVVMCLPSVTSPRLSSSAMEHVQFCSGNGHFVVADQQQQRSLGRGACHCHACFMGPQCARLIPDCVLHLFHGDPTMFESYWLAQPQATTVIPAWQGMSYFAHKHNAFLFVDHHLDQTIRAFHSFVGNAVTESRYIVLGTGSTQLFQASIYALSSPQSSTPTSIISATPYYSPYPDLTDFLKSGVFKWAGDAHRFQQNSSQDAYIEIVTSPNNPDGTIRHAVVNGSGSTVHDLAYYWPHYTPITSAADFPVMLFTFSKITGHAGTRLGWAVVEDERVAIKMAEFVRLNTLGVSQDAQARATTLLRTIMTGYAQPAVKYGGLMDAAKQPFFHYGQAVMEERWKKLRQALEGSTRFALPDYDPLHCSFLGKMFRPNPAFVWLRCKEEEDCQELLRQHRIVSRDGPSFGVSSQFVRVSMLDRHPLFDLLLARLSSIK